MSKGAGQFPSDAFLEETISVWQKYYQKSLTMEQATEIAKNTLGFFKLLKEWADKREETDLPPKPDSN